jgi:dGTPase
MATPGSPYAPYACDPAGTRGRLIAEPESRLRSPFQRDRDRIIHAVAFRRLKHKTQVFVSHEGDHFRTRLTHSLEVAQIARTIARALGLDEDLTEALALSHDLGHTAFGHAGEDVLQARMAAFGGFDHNGHALRIVTELEQRYPGFDGLNLSWETLEGLVKHNGPLLDGPATQARLDQLPFGFRPFLESWDLELDGHASLEAQVAAISDDIAYNNHDIDDGLRAGLFTLDELLGVPMVARAWAAVERRHAGAPHGRLLAALVRDLIGMMVDDVIGQTQATLSDLRPANADAVRRAGRTIVGFSGQLAPEEQALKAFLRRAMYFHPRLLARTHKAEQVLGSLFDVLMAQPEHLPTGWLGDVAPDDRSGALARRVCDFLAGMTDRYALRAYQRWVGPLGEGWSDFPLEPALT